MPTPSQRRRWIRGGLVSLLGLLAVAFALFTTDLASSVPNVFGPETLSVAVGGLLVAALLAFVIAEVPTAASRTNEAERHDETEHRALAEAVVDASSTPTVVVDADGDIAWLNSAAASTFGVDPEAAVGADRNTVIDDALDRVGSATHAVGAGDGVEYRTTDDGRDSRRFVCRRHEIDDGPQAGGWIEEYDDVTAQRDAVDALEATAALAREERTGGPDELLDAGRSLLDLPYAAFTCVDDGRTVEAVSAESDLAGGDSAPDLHERAVREVREAGSVRTGYDESAPQESVGGFEFDHAATDSLDAFLAAPVEVDGEIVGVLTLLGRADEPFTEWERAVASLLGGWLGLQAATNGRAGDGRDGDSHGDPHQRERLEFVNRILRHNLLNGLNLLNARAEQLEGGDDPEAEKHLSVIRSRVDEMADLIDTVRAFVDAAVTEGERALDPVPIRATLEERLTDAAERYDAEFRVHDLPDTDVRVAADGVAGEVIDNVLANAVEHNDAADPTVEVWATRIDGVPAEQLDRAEGETISTFTVHVADDGPGIDDAEKERLLTPGEADLGDPGHGFGFYLVRELMASYGGEVAIRDNEPRGTVVDLTFRIERP